MSQKMYVEDKIIILNLWDTAGQEIFDALSENYYRKADAAIIVYDVSKIETFEKCNHWASVVADRFDR